MVTQRHIKTLCVTLRVLRGLLLCAIPATALAMWTTGHVPAVPAQQSIEPESVEKLARNAHSLEWYAPLWQRDLKQSPIPAKVVEVPAEPRTSEALPTLLATLIDGTASYAHLVDKHGKTRFLTTENTIGAFRIVAIEPGRVRLQGRDTDVWLEIPKRKGR